MYHRGAASLRHGVADTVGMVINDLTNPFFAELAVGIEEALQGSGHIPFIANTGEDPDRQARVFTSMREHGAAGIILCPAIGTDAAALADLGAAGIPTVRPCGGSPERSSRPWCRTTVPVPHGPSSIFWRSGIVDSDFWAAPRP